MKFIQTRLGYVEDTHTHIDRFVEFHLEFTHFYRIPHRSLICTNFCQNHCSREFWNPYLVEYNREAMETARIVIRDESLSPEDHDEDIAASFDNVWRNVFYHITWRRVYFHVYRAVYRALDKTVNLCARREDVANTLSLPRDI